jgi:glyoxylase-like metal-dependent hydrolase (beta-lactamase superfamily II)
MEIIPFYEPESFTWTYLLADPATGSAAVIDPVWVYNPVSGMADLEFTERILERAAESGFHIDWVLETHAHADHLSSAQYIRRKTGARVAIGHGIRDVQETFVKVYNLDDVHTDGSQFDRLLKDGDTIGLGELEIGVIETPGHTSDSVTYLCGDAAL